MTKFFVNGSQLYILDNDEITIAEEVLEADGGGTEDEVEEEPVKKYKKRGPKAGGKKTRNQKVCKNCGIGGHMAKTCTNDKVDLDETIGSVGDEDFVPPSPSKGDNYLADEIQKRWATGGQSSISVCEDLNISLSTFNRIVQQHEIVRM